MRTYSHLLAMLGGWPFWGKSALMQTRSIALKSLKPWFNRVKSALMQNAYNFTDWDDSPVNAEENHIM